MSRHIAHPPGAKAAVAQHIAYPHRAGKVRASASGLALPGALHFEPRRFSSEAVSPWALVQPGLLASSGSVTAQIHDLACNSVISPTRPMVRPPAMATPSVPGSHSE